MEGDSWEPVCGGAHSLVIPATQEAGPEQKLETLSQKQIKVIGLEWGVKQ
jgi:hypothetical protein